MEITYKLTPEEEAFIKALSKKKSPFEISYAGFDDEFKKKWKNEFTIFREFELMYNATAHLEDAYIRYELTDKGIDLVKSLGYKIDL